MSEKNRKRLKAPLIFPKFPALSNIYMLPDFRSWDRLVVDGGQVQMQGQGAGFFPVWLSLAKFQEDNPGVKPVVFSVNLNQSAER